MKAIMKTNKSYIFSLIFAALTVFSGNVWGTPTTIASWGCASYSASTNYPSTGGDANNYSTKNDKAYFSTNKAFNQSSTNAYYGGSSGGAVITFSNLNLSGYTGVTITFYSRASKGGNFQLAYSTNGGTSWTNGNTSGTLATKNTPVSYSISFPANSTSINAIKLTHSASSGSLYFGTITISGNVPAITCATTSLTGFTYQEGSGASTAQSFTVSGSNLANNITVSAPANYEVSKSSGSGYASSVTLNQTSGTVNSTTVYVRLKAGLSAGTYNGSSITISSSPATSKSISLSGTVTAAAACTATPTVGAASLNGTFSLTGVGVQCASADPGSNCSIEYYGFVYGTSNASGRPNIEDDYAVYNNGAYAANFANTIVPISPAEEFTTGQTIYYRGFAMNGNADANASVGYSSAVQSFTPQGVLFYKEKALDNELAYKIVNNGTKVTAPSNPTMTGYTFAGWKNADGDAAFNCATTNIDDDYILYADWTINSHTLTWSTDGDALSGDYTGKSGKVNFGTTIVAPNTPTKTGYTFKAWSPAVAETMPDNDVTYTATWTADKYDITYKDQGDVAFSGTHAVGYPTQHTYGTATTLSTATKTGYTFGGWYTSSDCSTGLVTSLGATDYTAGMTLYAKWTIKSCTIDFDKQSGSGGSDNASATYGEALPDITAPTRLHYIFQGYYDAATEGTKYYGADGKSVKNWDKDVTANTTLYAHWTEHTYTNYRTLCCNEWDAPELTYGTSISASGTTTISIGSGTTYGDVTFTSNDESVLTVDEYGVVTGVAAGATTVTITWAGDATHCEKSMTTNAITVVGEVTVTFNKNGGSGTMDDQDIMVGTPTNLSANAYTAPSTCQYFYGWATSQALADAGTRAYEDEEEVTITEGMNLYAIWKTYNYTVTKGTGTGTATFELSATSVECNGEVTVTSTADASHKGDPTITITPSDAGTVNGNKIENIVKDITAVDVSYTAKDVYTVTWKVGGTALTGDALTGVTTSVMEGQGLTNLPEDPEGDALDGADTFMGWSKSELSGLGNSAPSDLFTAAGDEPEIDGNVTYHAVFATKNAGSELLTKQGSSATFSAGDNLVIVATSGDDELAMYQETSGTSYVKNWAFDNNVATVKADNKKYFTLVEGETNWKLGDATNGYVYNSSSNDLAISTTNASEYTISWDNTQSKFTLYNGSKYISCRSDLTGTNKNLYRGGGSSNGIVYLDIYKYTVTPTTYSNYITKVVALSSIAISAEAGKSIKTVYKKGETLDLTNMVVTATYADETSRAVTGYTVDLDDALSTDDTKFVVTYEENGVSKTAEQAIKVYELSGIAITAGPTTTTYKSGATLSTAGMEVTATWGGEALDKIVETVDGYTVDLSTDLATTDTEFEVSYTSAGVEKKTTKGIHVYDLSGIAISTYPAKTSYTAGDVFDPAGMVVAATWGGEALDKIVETVDGYTYSEEPLVNDADDPANVDVTISYTSNGVTKTATQEVTVAPKAKKIMTWHVANEDPFTTRIYIDAQDKYILAMPDDPDPVAVGFTSDYVFKGWTTATSVEKDGSDFTKATAGTEMSNDEDFYAVFAQKNGEDRAAGYRIVDEAPANGQTVIIARKVNSTYYAMTNSATPGYDALTITNGVISGTTTSYQWSVASGTNGVYLKKSSDYLHMNSDALKVANGDTNADIVFSSNGDGTYKAARSNSNTLDRWIVTDGSNGFDCSATEANALALYIFKYAAATVATYSNYRLVPSAVAEPTGLEAGTYYCESKSITLSQAAGKPIYYTLDGSTPDNTKTLYSSAIVLNTSKTIKAVAYDSETEDYSGVASAEYTIVTAIDAPTMTAAQTFYDESMEAEISHDLTSEGAVIHYSYDDASYSNYSDALTIDETKTVYAYATIGELTSPKVSATYTKAETANYNKMTSASDLAVGMKFIMVAENAKKVAGSFNSSYLNAVSFTADITNNTVSLTNEAYSEFTLEEGTSAWRIMLGDKFLVPSIGDVALKTDLSNDEEWKFFDDSKTITRTGNSQDNKYLRYNSSNPRFKTYKDTQTEIGVYVAPHTAYTLTFDIDGTDKTIKVVEGYEYTITNTTCGTIPTGGYVFADKWTDGTSFYKVGDKITLSADKTLTPCWKLTQTTDVDVNDMPAGVTDVVVTENKTLTVDASKTFDNLIVENGGKVTVADNMTLAVNDITIESMAGKSGQLIQGTNANVTVNGDIYIDIKFYSADALDETSANQWYMISAPFDVNLADGFSLTDGTPMTFGTASTGYVFDLFEYDGAKRANTGVTGWKRAQGVMHGGVACLIGFNPGQPTTIRLKAASNTISNPTSITLSEFAGDADNANWNGVANPTLHYTDISHDVQTYNNEDGENGRKYIGYSATSTSFVVGTAFFVQETGTISLSAATHGNLRAPQRESERYEACVQIFREGATEFADQMYVRASESALNEYEQGHDMITWNGTTGNTAMIWAENYGKRLTIEEAPLVNNKASYELGIFAPKAGTYSISVAAPQENAELYLTKNGHIIWNLTMSPCELELTQGQNEGYGLMLRANVPSVSTDVEGIQPSADSIQKVIIDEKVFILRGGQLYGIDGKTVR